MMFRRLTRLLIPALVLVVAQPAMCGDADPSLMGWWTLDGHTNDSSGNSRHGTINGDAGFVPGVFGEALEFDGDEYVTIDGYKGILGTNPWTAAAWINITDVGAHRCLINWGTASNGARIELRVMSGSGILRANHGAGNVNTNSPVNDGEWHHVALSSIEGAFCQYPDMILYVDGQDDTAPSTDTDPPLDLIAGADLGIGIRASHSDRQWVGSIDDVRLFDRVLTQEEIQHVMESSDAEPYPFALGPIPADGALLEGTWANLSWSPGALAVSHDVYVGENFDDVDSGAAETFVGNQAAATLIVGFPGFPIPAGLVPGTTYYWRVDEVNDADPNSPWKGEVWSFTIPPRTAYNLSPANEARFVDPDVTLSWTGGFAAKLHNVYFGDNFDDVNDAAPATFKGADPDASFVPGALEFGKTYYWRVDEFDGTGTHKGDVLSFETFPPLAIAISDPNLVGWWKLDEGPGAVAVIDSSGHGHHGNIIGNSRSIDGYDGDALELTGGYIQMKDYQGVLGTRAFSVSMWVKTSVTSLQQLLWWGTQSGGQRAEFRIHSNGHIRMGAGNGQVEGFTDVTDGQWHHVAATVIDNATNSSTDVRVFVDGVDDTQESTDADAFDLTSGIEVAIGYRPSQGDRALDGSVDDVRIYDKVLTQTEIANIMRIDLSLAWNPSPRTGSTSDITSALPLTWARGDNASQHDVYFGLDRESVANSDASDTTGVYRSRQSASSYSPAEGVEWAGGPYFWRVDEINADGTASKGRVWDFTVANFILIEDFESYTDNDAGNEAIWQSWIDGFEVPANGSQVGYILPPYAEQTIVNSGSQSMPLSYDNTAGVSNSQAELTVTSPRDWTAHGVGVLSFWFRGYPASVGSFAEGPVGTFTMTAAGSDIGGTTDQFHFAYKMLTGPGSITARVDSISSTHSQAKAGVMIRATLDPNSAHAFACVTPGNEVGSLGRTAAGGSSFSTYQPDITAPHWVRLERDVAGNFTVSHSANGSTWQPVELSTPTAIAMDGTVYVGLALTSRNTDETGEAKFSNVTITGTVGIPWAHQDVGIIGNDAEPLYVAVTDSTGASAVVPHDDPAAATIDTWTEWPIDLQTFADQGVNLADVDKIAVGLGAQSGTTAPGGSGTLFIDDIKLLRPAEEPQP
ncbi:MAG: LamG domain-containing protein [Planctomycetota bacterium]|jgi:hypothetical protein